MNLPTRKKKGTSLTKDRLDPDYSILLLLLNEPSVPITTRTPVTIRKNPSSLDTVSKMLSEDVKQLILLFWSHHEVEFQVFNFRSIKELRGYIYGDMYFSAKPSNYMYYSPQIPIEYPATLSAKLNSGIIAPIWKYHCEKTLTSSEEILKLESK